MLLNKLSGRLRDAAFRPCYVAPQFDVANRRRCRPLGRRCGVPSGTAGNRRRRRFERGMADWGDAPGGRQDTRSACGGMAGGQRVRRRCRSGGSTSGLAKRTMPRRGVSVGHEDPWWGRRMPDADTTPKKAGAGSPRAIAGPGAAAATMRHRKKHRTLRMQMRVRDCDGSGSSSTTMLVDRAGASLGDAPASGCPVDGADTTSHVLKPSAKRLAARRPDRLGGV